MFSIRAKRRPIPSISAFDSSKSQFISVFCHFGWISVRFVLALPLRNRSALSVSQTSLPLQSTLLWQAHFGQGLSHFSSLLKVGPASQTTYAFWSPSNSPCSRSNQETTLYYTVQQLIVCQRECRLYYNVAGYKIENVLPSRSSSAGKSVPCLSSGISVQLFHQTWRYQCLVNSA